MTTNSNANKVQHPTTQTVYTGSLIQWLGSLECKNLLQKQTQFLYSLKTYMQIQMQYTFHM